MVNLICNQRKLFPPQNVISFGIYSCLVFTAYKIKALGEKTSGKKILYTKLSNENWLVV